MQSSSPEDLYVEHLENIYDAEKQITRVLLRMSEIASTPELKSAFVNHLQKTETQIQRLDWIFERIQRRPQGKRCVDMEGLLKAGEEIMSQTIDPWVMDSALIGVVQKVEHYEVYAYSTVCAYARLLGDDEAVRLFEQTLDEEGEADEQLTSIADNNKNNEALRS